MYVPHDKLTISQRKHGMTPKISSGRTAHDTLNCHETHHESRCSQGEPVHTGVPSVHVRLVARGLRTRVLLWIVPYPAPQEKTKKRRKSME